MISLIDVKELRKKSRVRFFLHVFSIIILTIAVVTGSVLLLLFSSLDYIPNMVACIAIDVTYFCFLVFYFYTIFPIVKHYYRVFGKMNQVSFEHRRRLTFIEEKDNRVTDNVKFRTMNFMYKEGENIYQESLYVIDNDIQFEADKDYSIYTYQNIIVSFEEA